ncbi:hypothetical protein MLD38_040571 [Melastoma candidum]|nr:hypothetical protein MLD38_040571 [Melastoma candidum]
MVWSGHNRFEIELLALEPCQWLPPPPPPPPTPLPPAAPAVDGVAGATAAGIETGTPLRSVGRETPALNGVIADDDASLPPIPTPILPPIPVVPIVKVDMNRHICQRSVEKPTSLRRKKRKRARIAPISETRIRRKRASKMKEAAVQCSSRSSWGGTETMVFAVVPYLAKRFY